MTDLKTTASGTSMAGYRVTRREPVPRLDGTYLELVHERTGARHIHVAYPDDNWGFAVSFPTVPRDSTGVAHILEHVVLAGSERYPVRDPFFSMIPRSLQTFMNAMTGSDATSYPFSTRNAKDFRNLLGVYLDAVFFPLITEESFRQEGHRLEFEDPEDPSSGLRFKGVVYNEMKAQIATPAYIAHRAIAQALMPDLTYAQWSGGHPERMPDLTWEGLRAFHAVHYHPSNAYFFTSGDLDLPETLAAIDEQALSRFERIRPDVAIPDQPRFTAPREFRTRYPLGRDEDGSRRCQVTIAWLTAPVSDTFETFALRALDRILLRDASSPLRRALVESGLGETLSDGSGLGLGSREAPFAAGLKGTSAADADKIEELVLSTLEHLAAEGVDPERVDGVVHQLELESREVSNAGAPYALRLFFSMAGHYRYDGDPYAALELDGLMARLDAERRSGHFFEELIRRHLLDNPHRVRIVVEPDAGLEEEWRATELGRLAAISEQLADADRAAIVERAVRLRDLQGAKQDVSCLPTLDLSDVPVDAPDVAFRAAAMNGARAALFPQPTNGLSYVDVFADWSVLPDEHIDLLGLFGYALPRSGAAGDDHIRTAARIATCTGGIHVTTSVRATPDGAGTAQWLSVHSSALQRNHDPYLGLLRDLLAEPRFTPERLRELVGEYRSRFESMVVMAGNLFATGLAASSLSLAGYLDERIGGLSELAVLREISAMDDAGLAEVADKLHDIARALFTSGTQFCVTSEDARLDDLQQGLGAVVSAMPPASAAGSPPELPSRPRHTARTTAVPVSYTAKVVPSVAFSHPDAPALMVLGAFLKNTYLHREVRERGGAYGVRSAYEPEKSQFVFSSYRDPNIARTFGAYDDAVEHAIAGSAEPDDVKEAILASCSRVDPLESADTRGRRRFLDDLAGYTVDLRAAFKRGLLATTRDDLARVAAEYLRRDDAATAVIGNPARVEDANTELGGRFEVAPV